MNRTETFTDGCRIVTFTPEDSKGTCVWFHGGGWMIPLGEDAEQWGHDLAAATHYTVILPDYPLARDWQYPRLNGWCTTFWQTIARHHTEGELLLGGDSAGGQLALCALPARSPDKLLLIYPVTTLLPTRDGGSWMRYAKPWPLSPRLMDYFYDAYCPEQSLRYAASPLEQLSALPPTLLITAAKDILADQQCDLAARFPLTHKVYTEAMHIFLSRKEGAEHRAQALKDICAFLG